MVAFGVVLATGAARFAGFFASHAEALVLVRAPVAPPLVAAYLQARAIATTLAQTFARFAYLILVGIPTHATPLGLVREFALLAAATIALTSIILPRALARGAVRAACIAAGCALVLGALLPLARDALLVARHAGRGSRSRGGCRPGTRGWSSTGVAARRRDAAAGALLVALLCGAVFVAAARDAYPELYAFSLADLELRARSDRAAGAGRRRGGDRPQADAGGERAARALRGALAFVWLDAVTWSRRASPVLTAAVAALALCAGAGLGAVRPQHRQRRRDGPDRERCWSTPRSRWPRPPAFAWRPSCAGRCSGWAT